MAEMKPTSSRPAVKAATLVAKPASKPAAKPEPKPQESFLDDIYGSAAQRANEAPPPLTGDEVIERREQERRKAMAKSEARTVRSAPSTSVSTAYSPSKSHISSSKAKPDTSSDSRSGSGSSDMFWGAIWFIGGVAITVGTYMAAAPGGKFSVAYGAIIWGAIQFFRGVARS